MSAAKLRAFADVRARILAEHAALKRLMAILAHETARAQRLQRETGSQDGDGLLRIRDALRELHSAFELHLQHEEHELVPMLASADAWGPVRVTHVHDEHAAQRAMLSALTEDAGDGGKSLEEVADEVAWLLRVLLRDMQEEESKLVALVSLTESTVVLEQTDG